MLCPRVSFRFFSPVKMSWVLVLSKYWDFITMLNILFFPLGVIAICPIFNDFFSILSGSILPRSDKIFPIG